MTAQARFRRRPVAEQRPHSFERHGISVEDPYHWLKDPSYPTVDDADVLAYLRAENAYFEAAMAPHRPLIETLFQEMRGRIPEDDSSVPVRDGDWLYWWAFHARRAISDLVPPPGRPAASRAARSSTSRPRPQGKQYFRLGAMEISPDGRYAATMVDDDGSERFQLRIREIATGRDVETVTEVGIGRAGLDRRQPRHRLHRGQRAIGAATAPGCTGSASRSPRTARSTRRPRISPSPSASAAPRTGASS